MNPENLKIVAEKLGYEVFLDESLVIPEWTIIIEETYHPISSFNPSESPAQLIECEDYLNNKGYYIRINGWKNRYLKDFIVLNCHGNQVSEGKTRAEAAIDAIVGVSNE